MKLIKEISILSIMLIGIVSISSAQQKASDRIWQFHSINNLGLLEGQTGSSFMIQTINGIQNRSWFVGAGVGLDFYRYRTIPLFIDIRKDFGQSVNKIFVYADLGTNFSWVTDNEKEHYLTEDKFGNGFYSDLGLGYKVRTGKNNSLLLSLGYSFKKLTETYRSQFYYPDLPPNEQFDRISYSLNRLSIKIGWQF